MKRFIYILTVVIAAVLIGGFALANYEWVTQKVNLSFDPTNPGADSSTLHQIPMFLILFLAVLIGILLGGMTMWFKQGRHRRAARVARSEVERHKAEVERLRSQSGSAPPSRDNLTALPSSVPF